MAGIREKLEVMFGVSGADKFKKEFEQADRAVGKTSKGITGSMKAIGAAAVAYLSVQTVKAVSNTAISLTKLSDSFRVVQASSNRLAKSIGQNSNEILRAVRSGVGGAVNDLEILKQVNQAILLGIPVSAREMGNMAIVATRLGRAVGRDAASALGDLVTGIGRMSPLILDNLGITIKAEEAFRGLGEGATDAEKRLAFFNAVMGKATDLSKTLGEQIPPIGERLDKVSAKLSNLGLRIGDALSGPVGNLIDRIDALLIRMGTASTKAAALAKGGSANPNPFSGLPGLELIFPAYDAATGAITNISDFLAPGNMKRIIEAQAREGAFAGGEPQFRISYTPQYMDPGLRERSTPEELATVRMFEAFNSGQTFDMEPQIRDMTKDLDAGFKMVAKRAKEDLGEIPTSLNEQMARTFANMSVQFSALGLQGAGGIFSGLGSISSGLSGMHQANNMKVAGDGFLATIQPGLAKFTSAMAVFAGAVQMFGVAASISRENFEKKSNEEIIALADEPVAYNALGQRLVGQDAIDQDNYALDNPQSNAEAASVKEKARQEAARRGLNVSSSGSNAYSVSTSISETQANSILAVLETQRAQDAERNNLLGQSLAVQTDMKFLMSINSGNLLTFAG